MTLNTTPRPSKPQPPRPRATPRPSRLMTARQKLAAVDNLGRKTVVLLSGFSLYGSLNPWGRPEIGGFLLHPYLVVIFGMLMVEGLTSLKRLAPRYRWTFAVYLGLFTALSLQEGFEVSPAIKLALSLFTIAVFAVTLRDRDEVLLAALGAGAAVGLAGLPAIISPATSLVGLEGLAGGFGNKNTYSLYALPMILLALHFTFEPDVRKWMRIVFVAGAGLSSIAILSTGNRSGLLGLAVIALLFVVRRRRLRDVAILSVFGSIVFLVLTTLGSTEAMLYRLSNPENTQNSDQVRISVLENAFQIGMNDPVIGVGPPNVAANIATSVGRGGSIYVIGELDAHNLFAYNFAGGGFTLLLSLLAMLGVMMMRPGEWPGGTPPSERALRNLKALQSLLILFMIRAWFTEDALWTPGFPIAIGLFLALQRIDARRPGQREAGAVPRTADVPVARAHPDLFAQARARRAAQR